MIGASNKYFLIVSGLFKNFKTTTNNMRRRSLLLVVVLKFLNKPLTIRWYLFDAPITTHLSIQHLIGLDLPSSTLCCSIPAKENPKSWTQKFCQDSTVSRENKNKLCHKHMLQKLANSKQICSQPCREECQKIATKDNFLSIHVHLSTRKKKPQ